MRQLLPLLVLLLFPAFSKADDDLDPLAPRNEVDTGIVTEDTMIDEVIFLENQGRRAGFVSGGDPETARARMTAQLSGLLNELEEACHLSEAQKQKLTLGGRGDIKRFFDQVDGLRRKYATIKNDQNRLNDFWREAISLQEQYANGLFGEESLFGKTLRKTLSEEQQKKYQALLQEHRRARYRTAIAAVLSRNLIALRLRPEQHQAIQKLILDETQPPLQFGQHDQRVVLLRLSQLPAEKLTAVLDGSQWKLLEPMLLSASGTEDDLSRLGVIKRPKQNPPDIHTP